VAWGENSSGQCNVPALPQGLRYVEVAAGGEHSVARLSDGSVVAWGDDSWGQCRVPALPRGLAFVEVAAGGTHSAARRSDGAVVAWGRSYYGEHYNVPDLPSEFVCVGLTAGSSHGAALYERMGSPPIVYCTAKPSSLGCTPSISMVGLASASFGNGCTVSTVDVIGNKNGLFVHSTNGLAAQPFHGGMLCLQPPLRRHSGRNSGGTPGLCDGVLSEDLNDYIASGVDPALVAGATIWLQAWSRDPAAPFGDSLSDGISSTICP
jgi:hypothetical protein